MEMLTFRHIGLLLVLCAAISVAQELPSCQFSVVGADSAGSPAIKFLSLECNEGNSDRVRFGRNKEQLKGASITLKGVDWDDECAVSDHLLSVCGAHIELRNSSAVDVDISKGGLLYVTSNSTVIVSDGYFRNIQGVVWNVVNSALVVNNSTFQNITTQDRWGAAIAAANSSIVVQNCSFVEIRARGFTIAAFSSQLVVRHSLFSSNVHQQHGAVGFLRGGAVEISDTAFINNSITGPEGYGGGVVFNTIEGSARVERCKFINNRVSGVGYGGGLDMYLVVGEVVVKDVMFENNKASYGGGTRLVDARGSVTLRNVTCLQNEAGAYGGCIYSLNSQAEVLLDHVVVSGNRAIGGGGGIAFGMFRGNLSVVNSRVVDNVALSDHGGGVYLENTEVMLNLVSCTFKGNQARGQYANGGGVTVAKSTGALFVRDTSFLNNSAAAHCGAFCVQLFSGQLTLTNVSLTDNVASGTAAGLGVEGVNGTVHLKDVQFVSNRANVAGGMSYGTSSGRLHLQGVEFVNNAANLGAGGLLLATVMSQVQIEGSEFLGNDAGTGGGGGLASVTSTLECAINRTHIRNNKAQTGGAIGLLGISGELHLDNVNLLDNLARTTGGAIGMGQVTGLRTTLNSCLISGNQAPLGGGLALDGATNASGARPSFRLGSNVSIIRNKATIGGGLLLVNFTSTDLHQWEPAVHNNEANLQPNIFMEVASLIVESGADAVLVSRSSADQGLMYLVVNISVPVDGVRLAVEVADPSQPVSIQRGAVAVTDTRGLATFPSVKLQGPPGTYRIRVRRVPTTEEAQVYTEKLNYEVKTALVEFNVVIRDCQLGEFSPTGTHNCDLCPPGSFSLAAGGRDCNRCPVRANCSGGPSIVPLQGYWHSGPWSPFMERCPNQLACVRDQVALQQCQNSSVNGVRPPSAVCLRPYGEMQCSPGYEGPLCGSCVTKDANGKKYGALIAFRCRECMGKVMTGILLALGFLVLVGIILLTVVTTRKDNLLPDWQYPRATDWWKVLVLYLQYLAILGSLLVDWPDAIDAMLRTVSYVFTPGGSQVVSLDCVLHQDGPMPLGAQRWLLYLMSPVVAMVVLSVIWLAVWPTHQDQVLRGGPPPLRGYLGHRVPVTLLVTLHFYYPTLVRLSLALFDCIKVKSVDPVTLQVAKYTFWSYDLKEECWSGWHGNVGVTVGAVCVLVFCVIIPVGVLVTMTMCRHRLREEGFREHFGFLYRNYRDERCFWEGVVYLQTSALVTFSVLGRSLGALNQLLVFSLLILGVMLLTVLCQPYRFPALFAMQLVGLFLLEVTLHGMMSLLRVEGRDNAKVYKDVVGVLMVVINVVYVLTSLIWIGLVWWRELDLSNVAARLKTWLLCSRRPPVLGIQEGVPKIKRGGRNRLVAAFDPLPRVGEREDKG